MQEVDVLGVRVTAQRFDEAVDRLIAAARTRTPTRVHFLNVHNVVQARDDEGLREVLATATMVCCDGAPIVWLARRAGPGWAERVTGPDLMLALCDRGRAANLRHYFFGGWPGVPEALVKQLAAEFPGLTVAGHMAPTARRVGELERGEIIDAINAAAPDVLWVGLGSPKQEIWAFHHAARLTAPVILAVGAAFDFNSGRVRRAPRWMRSVGLEWLFRLAMDPRRLATRYVTTNVRFLCLLMGRAMEKRGVRG